MQITKNNLSEYTIFLRNKPKYLGHPFKNIESEKCVTNRTVLTYQINIRAFINYLYEEEYLLNNITKKYKIIRAEKKMLIPLSQDDVDTIDKIFNRKTETGSRNLCVIHLMLDSGARRGDVLNLKIENVKFNDGYILYSLGKGMKDRIVPLSPRLKKYLYTYLTVYRPYCTHEYFFCNTKTREPMTKDSIKSLFSRIKKHTDLDRLYPHLLRHTFATSYILGGGDIESLRIYMGHEDITTTQKYLHIAGQCKFNNNIYKLDKKFFKRYY